MPNPCGNGIHEPTKFEECDDNNNNNGDGCDETCFVENGFRCVNVNRLSFCYRIGGPDDPNIPVDPVEPAVPICGDGLYDPTNNEFCDDGNTNNGDGCNQFCRVESNNFECQNTVG